MLVGVLASGEGSILEALLAAEVPVALVVVDRPCRAREVAAAAGVPATLVERTEFGAAFDRVAYTERVVEALVDAGIELVVMAGFMTVLAQPAFDAFEGRILNTHPALLPAFRGAHAVRQAIEAGVEVTGCTVHVATVEVDAGPVLAQREVAVRPGDNEATLHERIKAVERELLPATVHEILQRGTVST